MSTNPPVNIQKGAITVQQPQPSGVAVWLVLLLTVAAIPINIALWRLAFWIGS